MSHPKFYTRQCSCKRSFIDKSEDFRMRCVKCGTLAIQDTSDLSNNTDLYPFVWFILVVIGVSLGGSEAVMALLAFLPVIIFTIGITKK